MNIGMIVVEFDIFICYIKILTNIFGFCFMRVISMNSS